MRSRWGIAVLVEAIIWAAVIIAVASQMEGSPGAARVQLILGGGAAASIILLGSHAVQERKAQSLRRLAQ